MTPKPKLIAVVLKEHRCYVTIKTDPRKLVIIPVPKIVVFYNDPDDTEDEIDYP